MRNDEAESRLQKDAVERLEGKGWVLKAQEYHVVPPYDQMGKGDLMFFRRDGERIALVVECKHMVLDSGKTARTKRTKARKKVKEQCRYYAACVKLMHRDFRVIGAVCTNESDIEVTCRFRDVRDAQKHFREVFRAQQKHNAPFYNRDVKRRIFRLYHGVEQ